MLVVLWLSAALAAIAFSVATSVRSETDRVGGTADGLRASYLATGSVERGIQWMMWGPGSTGPNGAKRWEFNKPRLTMTYSSGDAIVEMIPESAKFNINTVSPDDLMRVVASVSGDSGQAAQITAAIIDWRAGAGGTAPGNFSFAGGPTFQPRHASFEEIEELLSVQGVTPELYYGNYVPDSSGKLHASGGLRDCLSVWGGQGPFDINTASPALMQAVGMMPASITAVLNRRAVKPFDDMSEVANMGIAAPRMSTGGNTIWTLRATARLRRPDGSPSETVRTAAATVKLLNARDYYMCPVHVLRWYDDAWSQFSVVPAGGPPGVPVQ